MAKTQTTTANLTVKIIANDRGNPAGKLADAELHFSDGPLAGLKLIGFAVWERRSGGGRNVTLRPMPLRRSQTAKPISFSPASGPSLKCSSASASFPAGLPRSFAMILTVRFAVVVWVFAIFLSSSEP